MDAISDRNVGRTDAVMGEIRSRVAGRVLVPGARLPSIRAFAKTMHVSVSTVVEAYERLAAEGLIRARPGSGFYVSSPLAPLTLAEIGPKLDREIDPLWVSRQALEDTDYLKPGCGWLPPSWLPQEAIRRALRNLARSDDPLLTDYSTPLGSLPLRQLLSRRMAGHGISAAPEQILLTDSGTYAIDLICRFLLEPGDTVLVDDPCYFNFHALLRAHRANVVGVPMTPAGPDVEAFGRVLEEHRPRLYITNSAIHNPTGAVLSPVVAHRLLKLADKAGLTIVEDDIFADLEYEPAPRLAAFDGLDRVIHIGSFSKTLSASVRCGFIAARPDWIEGLVDLKTATHFSSGRLPAELVLSILTDGSYRRYLDELRLRLSKAMKQTIASLAPLGITPWHVPQAGMLLWCRLPQGVEAADVARTCLADHIVLAPGNVFSQAPDAGCFLRFNVAQSEDMRIFEGLGRALKRLG